MGEYIGWRFQRRVNLGKHFWLNFSKSGVSMSVHAGPYTHNSRGINTAHVAPGLSYRSVKRKTATRPQDTQQEPKPRRRLVVRWAVVIGFVVLACILYGLGVIR